METSTSATALPTSAQLTALATPALSALRPAFVAALATATAELSAFTTRPNGKPRQLKGEKATAQRATLEGTVLAYQDALAAVEKELANRTQATTPAARMATVARPVATEVPTADALREADAIAAWEAESAAWEAESAAPATPAPVPATVPAVPANPFRVVAPAPAPVAAPATPAKPAKPAAPATPAVAGYWVALGSYPSLAKADTCGTCTLPISASRVWELPDGSRHHRPCAATPALHVPSAAPAPRTEAPGTPLVLADILAATPLCFGCKLAWRADATPVVSSTLQAYHKLCAEWAGLMPTGTRAARASSAPATVPNVPLADRLAAAQAALAALTAEVAAAHAAPAPDAAPAPAPEASAPAA